MQPELVVLSHLRWDWVWQRPQHLISRLARSRRTWFVEEPMPARVLEPRVRCVEAGPVTRVWLDVPAADDRHIGYGDGWLSHYNASLTELLGRVDDRVVWLYTPMALDLARALHPMTLVYDVMDDLASFKNAPADLVDLQRQALATAAVVFTGGRSLHGSVSRFRRDEVHLFPSGVESEHYAAAQPARLERQRRGGRPVAGYVGVIDERLDLELVAQLAARLPDWEIRMVGPLAKIEEADLPKADNLRYPGPKSYDELPATMAQFDVALMPFAMNEATRAISPTKTLEYLASGLPVVSTHVPDVVHDFGRVVDLQADAAGFADACLRVIEHCPEERARRARPALQWNHWDAIAARMEKLVSEAVSRSRPTDEEAEWQTTPVS
jgi:glycosyltransferase involved in cell wall biosynthesis